MGDDGVVFLLLRVWPEQDDLRARLLEVARPDAEPGPIGVAEGVDDICALVRHRLEGLRDAPPA